MTILINPARFRLGADTAVGRLLGDEPSGLAVDFTTMQALIRDDTMPVTNYLGSAVSLLSYIAPPTKWIWNAAGLLLSGNTLRTDHDPVTHQPLGLLTEGTRNNNCVHNRDLTQVAWVKTNATAAKDQVGLDGVANSASSISATAAGATCVQIVTAGSAARCLSAYVKRLVGSGTVEMSLNAGTTWTPVTVTAGWTRVSVPPLTLANSTCSFRFGTSGDKIAIDFVQNETPGLTVTSPIATTGASGNRAVDQINLPVALFPFNPAASTLYAAGVYLVPPVVWNSTGAAFGDGTTANRVHLMLAVINTTQAGMTVWSGGVAQALISALGSIAAGNEARVAGAVQVNDFAAVSNGGVALKTDTAGLMPINVTALWLGCTHASNESVQGYIKQVKYLPRRASNAELQRMVA